MEIIGVVYVVVAIVFFILYLVLPFHVFAINSKMEEIRRSLRVIQSHMGAPGQEKALTPEEPLGNFVTIMNWDYVRDLNATGDAFCSVLCEAHPKREMFFCAETGTWIHLSQARFLGAKNKPVLGDEEAKVTETREDAAPADRNEVPLKEEEERQGLAGKVPQKIEGPGLDDDQANVEDQETNSGRSKATSISRRSRRWWWIAMSAIGLVVVVGGLLYVAIRERGVWKDAQRDLTWQVQPTGGELTWQDAKSHCEGLSLGGFSDWRLPTITDLRSLIRGCPNTELGSDCFVNNSCLNKEQCLTPDCDGCIENGGSGKDGTYLPTRLSTGEARWFWSSSPVTSVSGGALGLMWEISASNGYIGSQRPENVASVRCVR